MISSFHRKLRSLMKQKCSAGFFFMDKCIINDSRGYFKGRKRKLAEIGHTSQNDKTFSLIKMKIFYELF